MMRKDSVTNTWVIDQHTIESVPELKRLQKVRGTLALQYVLFWCEPRGFYTRIASAAEKDIAITAAVNQTSSVSSRLEPGVYKDPLFGPCAEKLTAYYYRINPLYRAVDIYTDQHEAVLSKIAEYSFGASQDDPVKKGRKKAAGKSADDLPTLLALEVSIANRLAEIIALFEQNQEAEGHWMPDEEPDPNE